MKNQSNPSTAEILNALETQILKFSPQSKTETVGEIAAVGDGIVTIEGLTEVMNGEIIEFSNNLKGLALNLNEDSVGAIVLGDSQELVAGKTAKTTGQLLSIGVSNEMLGRIVSPLGNPLDGKGSIKVAEYMPLEKIAPGVIKRKPVDTPLQTGILAIDAMIPIGRGQRELIIGDRGTGKSSVALTTILNQKDTGVKCIYVVIGQKRSFVAQTISILERNDALKNTIIVSATASDPASYQYLAPYAGTAIAEYFMSKGEEALIIYDDLTKHAWAYREISLLLRRPSGREAYPGDVFYLHSRLLERSVKLNQDNGGGSITSLPIIETQAGDVSAYIPTNVISITDGQIYLEADLFYAGVKPAINVGASVSRVGSSAQIKAMKQVAGRMRIDLAQYRDLAAFAQFSSDLDEATKAQLDRGKRLTQILKQGWEQPISVEKQVLIIWAANNGYLDQIKITEINTWRERFINYIEKKHHKIIEEILKEKTLSPENESQLKKAAEEFNQENLDLLVQEK